MNISMSAPDLSREDREAVAAVLKTNDLSQGPKIKAFEQAVADYTGSRHAVGVSSGTAGLHLACIAAGIGRGDVVITTPFSFIASANPILYQDALPVFVDVDPGTGNIDPDQVRQAAEDLEKGGKSAAGWLPRKGTDLQGSADKVKALLVVDVFGQPARYGELREIAEAKHWVLIEDSCEALGSRWKGQPAGALGDIGVFGFYPNKQMTVGEGGIVVTDHPEWAEQFRSLRNQGRDPQDSWLSHSYLGYNYRLDEMSAALGLSQFQRLDDLVDRRERAAGWYTERLLEIDAISTPEVMPDTTRMSWFVYVVRTENQEQRDLLMAGLEERGIPSRIYFSPIHLQPFYRDRFGYRRGDYPAAEKLGDTSLALPFSGVMREDEVDFVCRAVEEIFSKM
jgi:dTDP-4-amino-4,6-dideoxygalactose transaminase